MHDYKTLVENAFTCLSSISVKSELRIQESEKEQSQNS